MEADYKDFMSIEFEENVQVAIRDLSPKKNDLSSLSPNSRFESSCDSGDSLRKEIVGFKIVDKSASQNLGRFSINLQ